MLSKFEDIKILTDDKVVFYNLGDKFNRNICVISKGNDDGTVTAVAIDVDEHCYSSKEALALSSKNDKYGVRKILNPYIQFRPNEKSVIPQDEILIGDLDRGETFKSQEAFQNRLNALERAIDAARVGELASKKINIVSILN